MSTSMVILIVIVAAAVVWFVWGRGRVKRQALPAPAGAAATPGASTTTTSSARSGALGSYDDYRRVSPSNMVYGKLTCNRCGSNLIRTEGGVAACSNCGASLYRA